MNLPEKVLQFGAGVLLRGLPDFFIDKANRQGIFNGSVLIVKSTSGSNDFSGGDLSFTTYVRGVQDGKKVEEQFSNNAISRVLSASDSWPMILEAARTKELQFILSNTTEVGLHYVEESVFAVPPASFPGKLASFLYERFKVLGRESPETLVIPTELVPGNGSKLKEIVQRLVQFNKLGTDFHDWLDSHVTFCSSLVDRIVTKPSTVLKEMLSEGPGPAAIQTEPYRLWAIEGDDRVKAMLSFAAADDGVIIAKNIDYYRERKLRLLNGTHTISVCLGFLMGHDTVLQMMEDPAMYRFVSSVMMDEILPTIGVGTKEDNERFGREVLDRFRNPFMEHKLLSITLQSTMKMRMRNATTLVRYASQFGKVPPNLCRGFAAYLLFMKGEKTEEGRYYGRRRGAYYLIQDDAAAYFFGCWNTLSLKGLVGAVCGNKDLWDTDLGAIPGFVNAVIKESEDLQNEFSLLR